MRRIVGLIVFLLLSQFSDAALVPIKINFTEKAEDGTISKYIGYGTGFVVGQLDEYSIVVTAGHLFDCLEITDIDVYGKPGKLLHSEFHQEFDKDDPTEPIDCTDIAILAVKAEWKPLWRLEKARVGETVLLSGYAKNEKGITNLTGGKVLSDTLIIKASAISGMSGGPVLSLREGKYVCVGVITHGSTDKAPIKLSVFSPHSLIEERLNIFAKGMKWR